MSYGVALRNGITLNLGGIVALFLGYGSDEDQGHLLTEGGDNLVQENGGLLLLSGFGPDQAQNSVLAENDDNLVQEDNGLLLLEFT
jgi:hypothetical protein